MSEGTDWTNMIQHTIKWQALMNMDLNLWILPKLLVVDKLNYWLLKKDNAVWIQYIYQKKIRWSAEPINSTVQYAALWYITIILYLGMVQSICQEPPNYQAISTDKSYFETARGNKVTHNSKYKFNIP
jgi:hypothetical protein